jgi:hypothetical protein
VSLREKKKKWMKNFDDDYHPCTSHEKLKKPVFVVHEKFRHREVTPMVKFLSMKKRAKNITLIFSLCGRGEKITTHPHISPRHIVDN